MAFATKTAKNMARVLVVEDEGIIARDIAQTLSDLGYTVTGIASSGSEALTLAAKNDADLVLMDIRIRGDIDGIQTAEQIREQFRLPVVYLTAHTDDPTLDRAKASEPFGYIVKPFTVADLKITIEIALQRHRLQDQIEEKETWLTAVLRSIGDAVIVCNPAGIVTFLNSGSEELLGLSADEVIGKAVSDVVQLRNDQADHEVPLAPAELESSDEIQFTMGTLVRRDGSQRLVISSVAPIRKAAAEDAQGSVMLLRDVSDFRKTEQALRETNWFLTRSNEQLTALSHSITHDLKEPLRAITCYSRLLARERSAASQDAGPEQEYLQYITEGCGRMDMLLNALLDYYRAGIVDSTSTISVDASHLLQEALLNLQTAITNSGAHIEAAALPQVYAHPTALMQIFQNLVGNSLKYRSEATPTVYISAERDGDFWKFSVADNGSGFDPGQAEGIFGLFQRAHSRQVSGSGVGLATCRRLVEHYGGRIWAESKPGRGSQFYFTLPSNAYSDSSEP